MQPLASLDTIKLGGCDFPLELIDAAMTGKLAVFAGAGVSKQSGLPTFWELAKELARPSGRPVTEPLDTFIGSLESADYDVHLATARYFESQNAKPSTLHRQILRLFNRHDLRLVSTNFDRLFELALKETDTELALHKHGYAGNLHDLKGLVKIHGCTSIPEQMVLTQADFGKAYMSPGGHAAEFLRKLFENYVVLFIGYSHRDPIMNYLSGCLGNAKPRFSLQKAGDDISIWQQNNIIPIPYGSARESSHAPLVDAIQGLANWCSRSEEDWKASLRELALQGPDLNTSHQQLCELDYLLTDLAKVDYFFSAPPHKNWFETWGPNRICKYLSESSTAPAHAGFQDWVARIVAPLDPAITIRESLKLTLSVSQNFLHRLVCRLTWWSPSEKTETFELLTNFLIQQQKKPEVFPSLVKKAAQIGANATALNVTRAMLDKVIVRPTPGGAEPALPWDAWDLKEAFNVCLQICDESGLKILLSDIVRVLEQFSDALAREKKIPSPFDQLAWEFDKQHFPQYDLNETAPVLIHYSKRILSKFIEVNPSAASAWLTANQASSTNIIQQLVIAGIANLYTKEPLKIIEEIRNSCGNFNQHCFPTKQHVIGNIYASLPSGVDKAFLAKAVEQQVISSETARNIEHQEMLEHIDLFYSGSEPFVSGEALSVGDINQMAFEEVADFVRMAPFQVIQNLHSFLYPTRPHAHRLPCLDAIVMEAFENAENRTYENAQISFYYLTNRLFLTGGAEAEHLCKNIASLFAQVKDKPAAAAAFEYVPIWYFHQKCLWTAIIEQLQPKHDEQFILSWEALSRSQMDSEFSNVLAPHFQNAFFRAEILSKEGDHRARKAVIDTYIRAFHSSGFIDDGWFRPLRSILELKERVEFLEATRQQLAAENVDVEMVWNRWLGIYWADRANSQPVLKSEELRCLFEILPFLGTAFKTAAGLLKNAPATLPGNNAFYHINRRGLSHSEPEAVASLVCRFVTRDNRFHEFWGLAETVSIIFPHLNSTTVQNLSHAMTISGAPDEICRLFIRPTNGEEQKE